jgi:hypothetical protein
VPFDAVTRELSGEKYPTLSKVYPLIRGLFNRLKKTAVSSRCVTAVKAKLLENMQLRWNDSGKALLLACVLDPRSKNGGPYWSDQQKTRCVCKKAFPLMTYM